MSYDVPAIEPVEELLKPVRLKHAIPEQILRRWIHLIGREKKDWVEVLRGVWTNYKAGVPGYINIEEQVTRAIRSPMVQESIVSTAILHGNQATVQIALYRFAALRVADGLHLGTKMDRDEMDVALRLMQVASRPPAKPLELKVKSGPKPKPEVEEKPRKLHQLPSGLTLEQMREAAGLGNDEDPEEDDFDEANAF